uniref:Uncharacterized protein n=1 Tax=Rhizophora mucronata TaxID=61149 RepID=A0A2P2P8Q1_RHIMU
MVNLQLQSGIYHEIEPLCILGETDPFHSSYIEPSYVRSNTCKKIVVKAWTQIDVP